MPSISHSEQSAYLNCRRKHFYGYTLSLKRVSTAIALAYGSAGHKVLETYYTYILESGSTLRAQKSARKGALDAAMQAFDDLDFQQPDNRADLRAVLFDAYFKDEPYVAKGYLVKAVEQKYSLQYDDDLELRYPFVVDLIVRDPESKILVVDHKFLYDFYSMDDTKFMSQIPKYIGALRALNHKVDYGEYNMVRSRKIKAPTPEQSMQQLPIRPSGTRVTRTFLDYIRAAREIQSLKDLSIDEVDELAYRTENKDTCKFCDFNLLCDMQLNGQNTKLVLATEYEKRERGPEFEVSEDA